MKKVTSFTHHITAEGSRLTYTYSEISNEGKLLQNNERVTLVVMDKEIQGHIDAINKFLNGTLEVGE